MVMEGSPHDIERGPDTPPTLERNSALLNQHLQTIHSLDSQFPGRFDEGCRVFEVHHVHHRPGPGQAPKIEWKGIFSLQPQTGSVHHQVVVLVVRVPGIIQDPDPSPPNSASDNPRSIPGAVENLDRLDPSIHEGNETGPGSTSSSKYEDLLPLWRTSQKIFQGPGETLNIRQLFPYVGG